MLTAIGTSIDALAVGVTLALIGANIIVNALAIGAATFIMVTIGMLTGAFWAKNSAIMPKRQAASC